MERWEIKCKKKTGGNKFEFKFKKKIKNENE